MKDSGKVMMGLLVRPAEMVAVLLANVGVACSFIPRDTSWLEGVAVRD